MDNQKFSKGMLRMKKKDIIKMLRKEGIEPNEKQSKEELIKLLGLARKANEPSRSSNKRLLRARGVRPVVLFGLTLFVLGSLFALYKLNPTFNKNINFLVSLMEVENQNSENPNEPTILEKNGKTYVVYNHPLVDVEVFYDANCKRPECEIDQYLEQIRKSITPLVDIEMIDVNSPKFDSRTEKLGVTLLPTFSFDDTVEKLGNFEAIKDKFISRASDSYLLQVLPYRTIEPVETGNAKLLYGNADSETKFVAFLSLTSQQSVDTLPQLETVSQANGDAAVYYKYFFRNETDERIAKALECSADLDRFRPMFDTITSNFNSVSSASADRFRILLNTYVARADVDYTSFFECYDGENEDIQAHIASHKEDVNKFGVVGAPAVFVNKAPDDSFGVILGFYPENDFMKLVDDILNQENKSNLEDDE